MGQFSFSLTETDDEVRERQRQKFCSSKEEWENRGFVVQWGCNRRWNWCALRKVRRKCGSCGEVMYGEVVVAEVATGAVEFGGGGVKSGRLKTKWKNI
jgi:hypothetical protein